MGRHALFYFPFIRAIGGFFGGLFLGGVDDGSSSRHFRLFELTSEICWQLWLQKAKRTRPSDFIPLLVECVSVNHALLESRRADTPLEEAHRQSHPCLQSGVPMTS